MGQLPNCMNRLVVGFYFSGGGITARWPNERTNRSLKSHPKSKKKKKIKKKTKRSKMNNKTLGPISFFLPAFLFFLPIHRFYDSFCSFVCVCFFFLRSSFLIQQLPIFPFAQPSSSTTLLLFWLSIDRCIAKINAFAHF